MKKIICLVVIAAVVAALLSFCKKETKTVTVIIPEGSSVSAIADILKENEVISSKLLFRHKVSKTEGYLMPGEYTLSTALEIDEVIKKLKEGVTETTVTLTIPEGFSVEMIAKRIEELGFCKAKEFLKAADSLDYNFEFLKKITPDSNAKYKLQGFLYPNTYFISKTATPKDIINILLGEFEKQLNNSGIAYDNLYKAVTVASLLQREALVGSEKPTIAGVIYNRLDTDMLLQIDAAVVYAVTDGMYDINVVLNEDLKSNSPYNLYKYKGLPPGPICNPDINSIAAAVAPEKHDYLYYRTDTNKNDGSHIFTKTFEQHLNANN